MRPRLAHPVASTRSPAPFYNHSSYQFSKGDHGADEVALVNDSDSCPFTITNLAYTSLKVLKTSSGAFSALSPFE